MRKYSELYTLPIGIGLLLLFNHMGITQGWHLYGMEIIQKVFLAFVMMLIILPVSRVILHITFPYLFKKVEGDFDKNNSYNVLPEKERVWIGVLIFVTYCFLFGTLVAGI